MDVRPGEETYLGDGLYAGVVDGSRMIKLWCHRNDGEHYVYLEPEVFKALVSFTRSVWSPIWSKLIDP